MTRYSLGLLLALVLLATGVAAQESVSIVGKLNVAVISPVKTSLTVVQSVDQDPNAISVSLSSGFGFYVNDSFTGVVGIVIFDATGSSSASGLLPSKGILIPFLLCLLLLVTRVRGFVFGSAVLFLVCSLAFAAAAPSEVTVTITVPPAAFLNCLVLAVSDTVGSTADCSAVANLTCQVSTTPDVLGTTCACLKKPFSTATISAFSNPSNFDSSGSTFSCVYQQTGSVLANVTNTDSSPSCLDFEFQFRSESSYFNFDNVTAVTTNVPTQLQCSFDVDSATCSGILDAGQTADLTLDYSLTSCCGSTPATLATAAVVPHGKIVPLAQTAVNITITDNCV